MICNKCGHQNSEGTKFCVQCGNMMETANDMPAQDFVSQEPMGDSTVAPFAGDFRETLVKLASSPLFLATIICLALTVVVGIIQIFTAKSTMSGMMTLLSKAASMNMVDPQIRELIDEMNQSMASAATTGITTIAISSLIVQNIPTILYMVGLLLIFFSARSYFNNGTTGFTLVRILILIGFVVQIISAVILFAIFALIAIKFKVPQLFAVAVFIVAFMSISIVYYKKLANFLKDIIGVIKFKMDPPKMSMYVIVYTILLAVGKVFGLIGSFISSFLGLAVLVLFIILMFMYRNEVNKVQMGMAGYEGSGVGSNSIDVAPASNHQEMADDRTIPIDQYLAPKVEAALYLLDTGETIMINNNPFVIGKSFDSSDYVIRGDSTISRMHAQISCENGMYFLTDLNSTNHTYLNGTEIRPNEKVPIKDQDQISISRVPFVFVIS